MDNNIYKRYLFLPDLILVSIWALFIARYSLDVSILEICIVLLRIVLCFQMRDNTKWVLYSACAFAFVYVCVPGNEYFEDATQAMGYYIWYIFDSKGAITTYTAPHHSYPAHWIFALQIFWIVWNLGLPIIIGIVQQFKYHRKQMYQAFGACVIISILEIAIYCAFYYKPLIISLSIIIFAVAPYVTWMIKNRKSAIETIISDKDFITYISVVAIFMAATLIGLREFYSLRPIAFLTFPVFIYYAIITDAQNKPQMYSCLLAISGFAFWLSLECPYTMKIVCMSVSILLVLYAGFKMMLDIHRKASPLLFMFAIPCILYPMICGYNPYTVLQSEYTRPFLKSINSRHGLFVTQKDGHYGLRDRYGEILAPRYDKFEILDKSGKIVSLEICDSTFNGAGLSYPHYGIYDLRKQQFIVNPDSIDVDYIHHKDDETYQLHKTYHKDYNEILAELIMPGYYYADYYANPHLEPYFEDEDNPVWYFLGLGYQMRDDYDGRDIINLKFPNKHAHDMFARFLAIIHEKESPKNDLNRAKAFRRFVDDSPYYKGNAELALKHIEEAILPLNAEVNGEPTLCQAYLRDISSIRMSLAYADLLAESYWVTETEYRAYHNLCTALYNGYFNNLSWKGYYEEPYQNVLAKSRQWYDNRAKSVAFEARLWNGETIDIECQDCIKDIEEVNGLLLPLAPTRDNPYRFNKTWLEIHTALNEWYKVRCRIAEELEDKRKQQYIMITRHILSRHYEDISNIVSGKSL